MNPLLSSSRPHRSRGSALITVLLYIFILSMLVASVLGWSLTERRLTMRATYWLEARNAAEAVAEYGFSQIASQFSSHANPPSFDPGGSTPLALPPASFFTGSNVDTSSLEVIGGTANPLPAGGALYFVDPKDPNNAGETLKGQYVYRRDIRVLAKATVRPPPSTGFSPVTVYLTENVSVRGAPLFANAIFYSNNDLEAAPGPMFDIYGPVHVNGNLIISSQGTVEMGTASYINFRGPVSASGDVYHAWGNVNAAAEGRGYHMTSGDNPGEPLGNDPLNFMTTLGTLVNLKGSDGTWQDSTMGTDSSLFSSKGVYSNTSIPALAPDGTGQLQSKLSSAFHDNALTVWGGNLQTEAMDVAAYNPVGAGGQVSGDASNPILANTDAADSVGYGPHSMIDPPNTSLSSSDPYYAAKNEVEKQKLSNQAGLYVQVVVTPGTNGAQDSAAVNLYGWPGSAPTGTPANQVGPNGGILLGSAPAGLVTFIPFSANVPAQATGPGQQVSYTTASQIVSGVTKYALTTKTTTGATLTQSGTATQNGSGIVSPVTGGTFALTGGIAATTTGAYSYSSSNAALASVGGGATTNTFSGTPTTTVNTSGATVTQGMYDQREFAGINLVQIDMTKLHAALDETNGSTKDSNAITDASNHVWGSGTSETGYDPAASAGSTSGWNGTIYVQVTKSDGTPAAQTSVALANGKVASGSSLIPTVNGVSGLTLATNAPLYVLGNFNADGSIPSSAATTPDDGKTDANGTPLSAEVPVALAADAITLLSPNYFATADPTKGSAAPTTNTSSTSAYNSYSTVKPNASGSMEVAAAFITGIVPTSDTGFSGGVHNLPRFLEYWNSTVAIRGSLVSMYDSKTATGPWAQRYYSAPTRTWGFDVIFQNGHFPPLTPKVMSYRRVEFTDLSLGDQVLVLQGVSVPVPGYNSWKHQLWPTRY